METVIAVLVTTSIVIVVSMATVIVGVVWWLIREVTRAIDKML